MPPLCQSMVGIINLILGPAVCYTGQDMNRRRKHLIVYDAQEGESVYLHARDESYPVFVTSRETIKQKEVIKIKAEREMHVGSIVQYIQLSEYHQ